MKLIIVFTTLILFCPAMLFATMIGTAPAPYPYAEHNDSTYEYLGASPNANDGVTFPYFNPGQSANIILDVNSAGDFEWLSVWIDWDQSGSWDSSELMIDLQDQWFNAGLTTLTENINVPISALSGETWMRARYGFDGPYAPDGLAMYGEVEDYDEVYVGVVPEPNTILLLVSGLVGMAGYARIKLRRSKK